MSRIVQVIFILILSVQHIIGNAGNGFIALVNCIDWVKRRKLSSVDQILTALAISRIGLLWFVHLFWWIFGSDLALWITGTLVRTLYIIFVVLSHFNIWLATTLSIFYFLKIINFSQSIFVYLKWRTKKVVSMIQLMSVVLLIINIIASETQIDACVDGYKRNVSSSFSLRDSSELLQSLLLTNFVFLFIPFTLSLGACLLLIFSLWKHLKEMQLITTGFRDASTTAHMKALQTVVTFLLLYILFFVSFLVQLWSFKFLEKDVITLFSRSIGLAFPSCHSIVLILGNRKLKQVPFLVMRWLRCWFNNRKLSNP